MSNFEAKECNEFRCEQTGVPCVNRFLSTVIVPCYAFTHSLSIHSLCGAELFFSGVEQSGPICFYIADKLCIRQVCELVQPDSCGDADEIIVIVQKDKLLNVMDKILFAGYIGQAGQLFLHHRIVAKILPLL